MLTILIFAYITTMILTSQIRHRTLAPALYLTPDLDFPQKERTGSFSNCAVVEKRINKDSGDRHFPVLDSHSGEVRVTCHRIRYLVPTQSFQKAGRVIIGVLSNASEDGPSRRQSIRETWAKNRRGIFFLVAGPWHQIRDEYNRHGDLVWIDEDEVYNGEKSVLTFKSYSFLSIVHVMAEKLNLKYSHVFKTDDDSYLHLDALHKELPMVAENNYNGALLRHYIGQCQMKSQPVVRDSSYKWSLTINTYPENYVPRYCQGAGYAVSQIFINCAHALNHIANSRFMPMEDVAVGILAERCGIDPTLTITGEIKLNRYESQEAKKRVKQSDSQISNLIPIAACMTDRIVQHRVIDAHDMKELHETVLDPEYCRVTRRKRSDKIWKMEEKGLEWFG